MELDILAIGAHPDDVELCCGGTILRHVDKGYKVGIIDLTKGELGTRGTPEIRQKEAQQAADILGAEIRENLGMPDGFFEVNKVNQRALIKKIRQYQPQIILTNAIEDRHPDHGRAAELVEKASFKSGLTKITTQINGEPQERWRPQCIYHFIQFHYLEPDFVVDITDYKEQRREAVKAHQSQFYSSDSDKELDTILTDPSFFKRIDARAREYGRSIGVEYAEGFNTYQKFGIPDLLQLQVAN